MKEEGDNLGRAVQDLGKKKKKSSHVYSYLDLVILDIFRSPKFSKQRGTFSSSSLFHQHPLLAFTGEGCRRSWIQSECLSH